MDSGGWDDRYAASELVWGAEANRFVMEEFTGLPVGRALDLAAGEGRNAIWLAGLGWQVTAVDFSAVAIRRARQLAGQRDVHIDWVVADVVEYQPEARAFDAVLIAYLHLRPAPLATVLAHAAEALAPGGRIFVVGHDLTNLRDGVGGPPDPDVLYTPDTIAAGLPGLTIQRAERALRPVSTEPDAQQAIDTLVRAVREQEQTAPDL